MTWFLQIDMQFREDLEKKTITECLSWKNLNDCITGIIVGMSNTFPAVP